MFFDRPRRVVASLLVFSVAIWFLVRRGGSFKDLDSKFAFDVYADSLFDPRLYPERHALRDAKTLELDWVVRQELRSPDGVQKSVYTVNGLFPGPTIEARRGDRVILRVHNGLQAEPTAIHFHGIRQIGSNSMDGTPGLTQVVYIVVFEIGEFLKTDDHLLQCAIQPKHSFLYNFTVSDQTGTYWWHSHSLSQRADGLFGAFIIHDSLERPQNMTTGHSKEDLRIRTTENSPFSERILLLGDWYHRNATEMLKWYRSKKSYGFEPTPETALFNGVNAFDCSRASRFVHCDRSKGRKPSVFLDPHAKTKLRLVNTGNLADLEISLGSHTFIVVEADGSQVSPQRVNSVVLSPGQRYSVLLEPHLSLKPQDGDSFWLRLSMSEECFNIPNAALDMVQFARVVYGKDTRNTQPLPFEIDPDLPQAFDPFSLVPLQQSLLPPSDEQIMIYVNSMKLDRLGGIPYGYVNQTSWVPHEDQPLLLRDSHTETDWGKHQLVVTTDLKDARVIELIINNLDEGPHPFHLHGHHFYPLLTHRSTFGWGMYNYTAGHSSPEYAPVLRDTFTIPRRGHAVIRFLADAPGMWLFHCHVLVHLSTGMAMIFNVRPDIVPEYEKQSVIEGCRNAHSSLGITQL